MADLMAQAQEVLRTKFGHEEFRPGQEEALRTVLEKEQSCLVLLPTGMGKSLCYQIPAFLENGLTLVISPLIALMKDQCDKAQELGLKATFINSSLKRAEREKRYQQLTKGQFQLIFVTPERFKKTEFLEALRPNSIALLAVDEAHCISHWGHDFRPDYSRLGEFRENLGAPKTLALTATATEEVQEDILRQLGLNPLKTPVIKKGLERPNLFLQVSHVHGRDEKIRRIVANTHRFPGAGIVYFSLISTLEQTAQELRKLGIHCLIYHGQKSEKERSQAQNRFIQSTSELMLATPAFGLGIDKPDIRRVMHAEVPGSVEAYYQEVGRAGRDGINSHCELLYDPDDMAIQMDFLKWSLPDPSFVKGLFQLLRTNKDKVQAEGLDYLRSQLNFYNSRDFRLETSLNLLERWGNLSWEKGSLRDYEVFEPLAGELTDENLYQERLKRQQKKLYDLMLYAKDDHCRKSFIYNYFGLKGKRDRCGFCDLCQERDSVSEEE